jgi:hypothetical protein
MPPALYGQHTPVRSQSRRRPLAPRGPPQPWCLKTGFISVACLRGSVFTLAQAPQRGQNQPNANPVQATIPGSAKSVAQPFGRGEAQRQATRPAQRAGASSVARAWRLAAGPTSPQTLGHGVDVPLCARRLSNSFVAPGSIAVVSASTVENLRSYWSAKVATRMNTRVQPRFALTAPA